VSTEKSQEPGAARRAGGARELISVLIVNWNTRELVLECLSALPRDMPNMPCEVIVVDNGSLDGSAEALKGHPSITLIRNNRNLGYAAAVNQAYRRSSGEFVLLLNSDVVLNSDALASMTKFLIDHPAAAGVGPLYVNPDGSPQPFHFRFPTFKMTLANGSAVMRKLLPGTERDLSEYRMVDEDFSQPTRVPQPSASCLLLRKACLPEDYIFDERYPIYFNDVQLARWIAERGFALWVTPSAKVSHEAHSSTSKLGRVKRRQYLASVVLMLSDTEPLAKVWLYRVVVFLQNVPLSLLRRKDALRPTELWGALSGNPGPLPREPL
jgi:GT2 family glycosyltransferase